MLRWHALAVDVSTCEDLRSAVRLAGQALDDLLTRSPAGLPLAVRVNFTGQSEAHAALASDEGQLRQEMIAQAVALDPDRIWIEKVRVDTTALATQAAGLEGEAQDALNALQELAASAHADPEFLQALQADWQAMLEKLPHDVLQASLELAELRQADPSLIADRVRQATPVLIARVAGASAAS